MINMLTHTQLINYLKKGIRNRNWHKLERIEKALYRAAIEFTKIKNKILNPNLITILTQIIRKLILTPSLRILKAGLIRARQKLILYEKNGVFKWCPQLKKGLLTPSYIAWLGLGEGALELYPQFS